LSPPHSFGSKTFDCIVVGGGLIGMLTARRLREAGARVLLLDRGRLGREASWAGGGILSPLYPWRYAPAVNRMAIASQRAYPQFAARLRGETGIDPEWTPSGMLVLDAEEEQPARRWSEAYSIPVEELTADSLRACEPALASAFDTALWLPTIAQIRSPRLVKALGLSLSARGVEYYEHTEVLHLRTQGDAVTGVQTPRGAFHAERVLIASGAWSARLIPPGCRPIQVAPVRGQIILLQARPGLLRRIVLQRGDYLIPRRDGRVLVGSTLEHVGYDQSTTREAREALWAKAIAWVPTFSESVIEHQWSGLRPSSPSNIPYVGQHPDLRGLFLNTGHFRYGVVLGLASAALAADLMLDRAPELPPEPYALGAARGID
jgi:glycine oxidase